MKKNLLIRMDKIGDLVLTLPVDQIFESSDENVWFITQGLEFFPQNATPKRQFVSFKKQFCWSEFRRMRTEIKKIKPDRAVVFHAPWWVGLALWSAGVPLRVGVRSKWHSYLFFNLSLRQKRSKAEKHEAHYGLELVQAAINEKGDDFKNLKPLSLSSGLPLTELNKWKLSGEYIVVHPGMAGSALNWPIPKYIEFIKELSKTCTVVVTSGPNDQKFVEPIRLEFLNSSNVKIIGSLSLKELMLILEKSKGVLAPSTGVLHLAASSGVPALGIYSPIGVERAVRWGPRGLHVDTLTPELNNNSFNRESIMDTLSTERVIKKFKQMAFRE
jgi:heptosyltransferase I